MNISEEQLSAFVAPYEAIYTISDHIRTLVFAISDGALPSNVGGGYNLRVILRRALSILERLGWKNIIRVEDIAELHIDYLRQMYPELEDHRQDVKTILQLEASRYSSSRERMNSVAMSLKSSKKAKELTVDDLIRLYESDGITPDFLMEQGIVQNVPSTFYTKLAELHTSQVIKPEFKTNPWARRSSTNKITLLPRRIDTPFSCKGAQGGGRQVYRFGPDCLLPKGWRTGARHWRN